MEPYKKPTIWQAIVPNLQPQLEEKEFIIQIYLYKYVSRQSGASSAVHSMNRDECQ